MCKKTVSDQADLFFGIVLRCKVKKNEGPFSGRSNWCDERVLNGILIFVEVRWLDQHVDAARGAQIVNYLLF